MAYFRDIVKLRNTYRQLKSRGKIDDVLLEDIIFDLEEILEKNRKGG